MCEQAVLCTGYLMWAQEGNRDNKLLYVGGQTSVSPRVTLRVCGPGWQGAMGWGRPTQSTDWTFLCSCCSLILPGAWALEEVVSTN